MTFQTHDMHNFPSDIGNVTRANCIRSPVLVTSIYAKDGPSQDKQTLQIKYETYQVIFTYTNPFWLTCYEHYQAGKNSLLWLANTLWLAILWRWFG